VPGLTATTATQRDPERAAWGPAYQRRDAPQTTLYQVVRDNLETLYRAVEDGFASAPLPKFVKQEFESFLDCGVLCRGAALLVCEQCPCAKVIALSCKGRAFVRPVWAGAWSRPLRT
jgi:hypothetical protein